MLYLIKSYLLKGRFIYKVGFSDKSNLDTRLNSYFYHSPGNEVIALRQGDEMLEDLIHYYLYYLGYRYQKNGRLDEWFMGDPEVLSIFHISRESLERKLWKHRNEVFNKDKFKPSIAIKTLDFNLFKYLYNKNKNTFVGERYMLTKDKRLVKQYPKSIDIAFYKVLIKYFPDEVVTKSQERAWEVSQVDYQDKISVTKVLEENSFKTSEYCNELEKEIQIFLDTQFYTTGVFREKMKMYCEFMDSHKNNKEVSDILYYKIKNPDFRKYYNFYGTPGCSSKKYQKENLELGMIDASKESKISEAVHTKFKSGEKYLKKDIKQVLQSIYRDLGITSSKPKATDLGKYFDLERTRIKQQEGYLLKEKL